MTYKRKNNSSNLFNRSWKDSHQLNKRKWSQSTNRTFSKSRDKLLLWRKKLPTMNKPCKSTTSSWKDCKKNCKTTRKNFLFKKREKFNKKKKKRPLRKILSRLSCPIKDLQVEVLTWLFDRYFCKLIKNVLFVYFYCFCSIYLLFFIFYKNWLSYKDWQNKNMPCYFLFFVINQNFSI